MSYSHNGYSSAGHNAPIDSERVPMILSESTSHPYPRQKPFLIRAVLPFVSPVIQSEGGGAMPEMKDGCVKPARGPIMPAPHPRPLRPGLQHQQEVSRMLARVGKEAIDFEANAFVGASASSRSSSQTTKASGLSFASIRAISPSSDQPNWRRSPQSTGSSRRWGSKSWP